MDKLNKLSLPAVIIIASLILGGFYFASQVIKQKSIERQQEIKLETERQETEAKAEQEQKEYVAKRKMECYEMYLSEKKRVSNVENYGYVENYNLDGTPDYRDDTCEIIYENTKYNKRVCEQKYKEYDDSTINPRGLITECTKHYRKYR